MLLNDNELVQSVKKNSDNNSFLELVKRHEKLFYNMLEYYKNPLFSLGFSIEDLHDEKFNVFFDAINSYNPNKKMKFSTYLGQCTRFYCLNLISKNKYKIFEIHNEEETNMHIEDLSVKKFEKDKINIEMLIERLDLLPDKRIKKVFEIRFSDKKKVPWHIVAQHFHISPQTVCNLYRKGLQYIKENIKEIV